jgi:hypothetical protein
MQLRCAMSYPVSVPCALAMVWVGGGTHTRARVHNGPREMLLRERYDTTRYMCARERARVRACTCVRYCQPCWLCALLHLCTEPRPLLTATFQEREGSSPPRWGDDVHAAEFRAPVLGGVSLLSCLLDRAVAHGGDASSVNVGGFDAGSDSFVQSAGASYRQVVDLASLGQSQALSWFIAPAGQHGNPLSGWYDNALSLWQTGEYWRMELAGYTVQQATTMQASSADRPDEL